MDNSEQKIIKNKRTRRTDAEIKKSIFDAIYQIIKDKGISVLSINLIVEYSKISPLVINKRFKDLNDIIEQFISRWDYWTDLFSENKHQVPTKESYRETLESVLDIIWKKKAIQQILAWQITEDSWLQDSTIKEQEAGIKKFTGQYDNLFKDSGYDIHIITAIFLASIYYISSYKKKASFCGLNLKGHFGNIKLLEGISQLSGLVFENVNKTKEKEIAKKMLESGDHADKVMHITGLSKEEIKAL
ncbi:MAG: hypothetical protein LBV72_08255 [Tannerella sp.]|jgi:hypothetical protein|nr:hypothetical protein [Tannerella sp.]